MVSPAILATSLLLAGPVRVLAQASTVVCLSSFNWTINSLNQNPCMVASYLQGACDNGQYTVNPLPLYSFYLGPGVSQQNACQCSSITYNTMSACAACQNREYVSWSTWNANCTTLSLGVFLPGIPNGTAVPAWAFQDLTADKLFNLTVAQSVGDNPESIGTHVQSTSTLGTTSTLASASSVPTETPASASSGNGSNTKVIAASVVGGVVGVALIAGVVIFFVMKKKPSQIPPLTPVVDPPLDYTDATFSAPQMAQHKLYDPSDPSTFPTSVSPIPATTEASTNIRYPTITYTPPTPLVHPGGRYNGMPEI